MTSGQTVKSSVLRSFKEETDVSFDAKVVSIVGPFSVKKKDGGEFLKFEAILENCEREAFKINAFGPQLSFQLQRLLRLNALTHFENVRVTPSKYASYRTGTLPVEFKYSFSSKVKILKEEFCLPELPLSTVADIKASNNVRRRVSITTEYMVASQDNRDLMGNVTLTDSTGMLRTFCVMKGVLVDNKNEVRPGTNLVITTTVRKDSDSAPQLRVESWHDVKFYDDSSAGEIQIIESAGSELRAKAVTPRPNARQSTEVPAEYATVQEIEDVSLYKVANHRVKCSLVSPFEPFGNAHVGRIFVEDGVEFLSANLRVKGAPGSLETLPADTEVEFVGTVDEEEDELVFTTDYRSLKVPGEHSTETCEATAEDVFSELEATDLERISERTLGFVVVKLAKRFEQNEDGYMGYATMVDKRSLALKVLLLGLEEEWPTDLPVNSVIRLGGAVERTHKRYSVVVGSAKDLKVLEEGRDRKSLESGNPSSEQHSAKSAVLEREQELVDKQSPGVKNRLKEVQLLKVDDCMMSHSLKADDFLTPETASENTNNSVEDCHNAETSASSESVKDCLTAEEEAKINAMAELQQSEEVFVDESTDGAHVEDDARSEHKQRARAPSKLKRENTDLRGFGEAFKNSNGVPAPKRLRPNSK